MYTLTFTDSQGLSDLLTTFLTTAVDYILYIRKVYPPGTLHGTLAYFQETFLRRSVFGVPVFVSLPDSPLNSYVKKVFKDIKVWINKVQKEKVCSKRLTKFFRDWYTGL